MNVGNQPLYLKEDVYFEPLFNQWYAWISLISPVTAARHMIHNHKRIMKSFISNYQLHIIAASQPGFAGGEFMNCSPEQLPEIKALVEKIETELTDLSELSDGVKQLDELLAKHENGQSIEPLYQEVPDALKGYVELLCDMAHNPSFRIFENMLYHSKYYKKELQSVSFGLLSEVTERPFCFSTPRLPDDNHIQLSMNFSSPMLDELLQARTKPIKQERVDEIFAQHQLKGGLDYNKLFTTQPPASASPFSEEFRIQYLGHAGMLIETQTENILVDPVIASRGEKNTEQILSFGQLPEKIDYVFITHAHQDHACLETLLQLRYKIGKIVVPRNNSGAIADPSLKLMLKKLGFEVVDLDELEEVEFGAGRGISLPFLGEHGDLNIYSKTAWLFEIYGKKIFMGADTSILDKKLYERVYQLYGELDVLAIGMECVGAPYTWIYGALCTTPVSQSIKKSRRLNGSDASQAIQMVDIFNPKQVYLYALGLEPWYKYFMGIEYDESSKQVIESNRFEEMCNARNLAVECLFGKTTLKV